MRIYRIIKNNPPTESDMLSHWDLGKRPVPHTPRNEAAYKEISTFDTPEAAAAKARARDLGEYIAELDVPDETPYSYVASTGHAGLRGTTPGGLLACVQHVRRVDEILAPPVD